MNRVFVPGGASAGTAITSGDQVVVQGRHSRVCGGAVPVAPRTSVIEEHSMKIRGPGRSVRVAAGAVAIGLEMGPSAVTARAAGSPWCWATST
ncbi:hypothetical protein SLA_6530 [Streptomyces laurentii]|uniref:Uncharacterized protein n=1 Tax=Streptomyces laurentii TaxID=39478 RepID=A0A160P7Y3_STRLU|nr:hypothetical protein SLA_6530 [Streptomyces laurentii]